MRSFERGLDDSTIVSPSMFYRLAQPILPGLRCPLHQRSYLDFNDLLIHLLPESAGNEDADVVACSSSVSSTSSWMNTRT